MQKNRNSKLITPEMAMTRLETLCARAEHCTSELRDKLFLWKISPEKSLEILNSLKERHFVDDARYAKAMVSDKINFSRWGRKKILQALMAKRIDRETIANAIELIDEQVYEQNLHHLLILKAASLPHGADHTYEGRTKLFRFAISRGYESDLASRLIKNLFC